MIFNWLEFIFRQQRSLIDLIPILTLFDRLFKFIQAILGQHDQKNRKADGDYQLRNEVIEHGLNIKIPTPMTDPETVIGRVSIIKFSSIRFFVLLLFLLPKLEYMDATVPPSKKI